MAYTPLPTFVTGDIFTAANANTYWRDNFAASVPDIFTTKGELVYGTGNNAADLLAIGAARKVLTVNAAGDAPEWANKFVSGCIMQRSANQSIPHATITTIVFDNEIFDSDNYWSSGSPSAVIVPKTGVYQFSGKVLFAANSTGTRYVFTPAGGYMSTLAVNGDTTCVNFCFVSYLSASSNAYISAYQSSGGALNITAEYQTIFLGEV